MIVSKQWKYVYSAGDNKHFLFDRIGDPQESRNSSGCAHMSTEEGHMRQAMIRYLEQVGAEDALEGGHFKIYHDWNNHYLQNPLDGLGIRKPSLAQVPAEYR